MGKKAKNNGHERHLNKEQIKESKEKIDKNLPKIWKKLKAQERYQKSSTSS